MNKDSVLLSIYNYEFKKFQDSQINGETPLDYDLSQIHPINIKEFEDEGYFLIICLQDSLDEVQWRHVEIWKVYKTEKCYHVLEFENSDIFTRNFTTNYRIYNYFDYDKVQDTTELWRNSTPVIGMKLPDNFSLHN